MKLSTIKRRVIECLTRDVRRKAEEALAEELAAHVELEQAHGRLRQAESMAATLQDMDTRNHYSYGLERSYQPKERPA